MIDSLPEQCSGLTDFELVELIKNKNLSAFEELMSRYERQVYSLSLRIIGKPEGAQEAVQDTFLSVFKNISSFRGNSAFKTWIYRIATNSALMYLRMNKKNKDNLTDMPDMASIDMTKNDFNSWSVDPEEILERDELSTVIRKAVDELPDLYRVAFILRDIEGFSNNETADILNLSLPALKSRVLRARLKMREALSDYIEERVG